MSRTYSYTGKNWHWRQSGGQEARHRSAERDRELEEMGYKARRRHASLCFPHYTSAYADIYPSILDNKWVGHTKPFWTRKKR